MSESVGRWVMATCPSVVVVTAAVALILLPGPFYVPELSAAPELAAGAAPFQPHYATLRAALGDPLGLLGPAALALLALLVYLCEWIQRKVMERRILKLHGFLAGSLERLRRWDAQQEHLEATLKLVQNATSEYNLLLYLLLRQQPSDDKARDELTL